MQENHKYNIYMFIATIFFGMTYVLTKICLNYSTELHIISFRFLIAFVISLIFLQRKIFPIKIREILYSLVLSVLLFMVFITMTIGVKYTTAHVLITERFVKNNNPITLGVLQFGGVAVLSFLVQYPIEKFTLPKNEKFWISLMILSVFCTVIAYIIQTISQKKLSSTLIGFILSLEPIFSGIFGYFILNEYLSLQQYIGALLLLISVISVAVKN